MERRFRATAALTCGVVWLLAIGLLGGLARGQATANLASLTNDSVLASLTNDFKIPLWNETIDLRGTIGYNDNVQLANTNRQGSPFWDSGGDLLVFRLPTGPWTLSLFASADDTRFFGAHSEPSEQLVIAAIQAKRALTRGWSSTFAVNYFFQHQILDLPPSETNQAPVSLVLGNNFTGRWMARKEFQSGWAQFELGGGKEIMAAPLDSFWQAGPRLDLGYRYGTGSDLRLNYQWNYTLFDDRQQVNSQGDAISGTALRFTSQTTELTWHEAWNNSNNWHTFVIAGYELNEDNGSGYFNYSHYRLSPRIEYRGKTWKFNAFARGGYYNFPFQPVVPGNATLREKVYLTAGIHAEKQLLKSLRIFADYTYDRSVSDLYTDTYFNDTVKLGFDWQF